MSALAEPVASARKSAAAVEISGASTFNCPARRPLAFCVILPETCVPPALNTRLVRRFSSLTMSMSEPRSIFSPFRKALPASLPESDAPVVALPSSKALKSRPPSESFRSARVPCGASARNASAISLSSPRALPLIVMRPDALSDKSLRSDNITPKSKSALSDAKEPLAVISLNSLPMRKSRAANPALLRAIPPLSFTSPLRILSTASVPVRMFCALPSRLRSKAPLIGLTLPDAFTSILPARSRSAIAP